VMYIKLTAVVDPCNPHEQKVRYACM